MKVEIREAVIEDFDKGLLEVFIEGYRYHQNGRPDIFADLSNADLKKDFIENFEKLSTIVPLENNRIVGYLSYKIKKHHTKKLDVDQLIISEKYRNKGYGKKLMDKAKEIGLLEKCDRIELNCWMFNENALNMYEHIGYTKQRIMYEMSLKN